MDTDAPQSLYSLITRWSAMVAGTNLPQPPLYEGPDVLLADLVEHTAAVKPRSCFVARVRAGSDGHRYIGQAVQRGAALVIGQRPQKELWDALAGQPYWQVTDSALVEAWLAAAWYGFPSRQMTVIGITGTDGKTTTANILFELLRRAGKRAGLLSTLRAVIGDEEEPLALHVTTPEAPVVQRYLRRMAEAGLSYCILETTSHGLAQERVGGIDFDLAVVTNITHEHLDYHGDYGGYFAAKASLFERLGGWDWGQAKELAGGKVTKTAVLNRDDASFERLAAVSAPRQLSYGLHGGSQVTAEAIRYGPASTQFTLSLPGLVEQSVTSPLVGEFNLYNMLAAATAAHALGLDEVAIGEGLGRVPPLTGRMQRVNRGQEFLVVVDFAHTPNALSQAIGAARGMTGGRIITVFGSAGKRDVEKRRLMAEIAAHQADLTVLTAEDPRTESLDNILAEMAAGCRSQGGQENTTFWRVPDRGRAIYFALSLAAPGDVVLVCGKGHEQSMCFGTIEYAWDDILATDTALEAFLAGQPMPDLGLPTF